jgi:hypothetical protein
VFPKGGALRIDVHDKGAALEAIVKILTKSEVPPAGSVTINQTNVGPMSALEVAKRVHLRLVAARHAQAAAPAAPGYRRRGNPQVRRDGRPARALMRRAFRCPRLTARAITRGDFDRR